MHPSIKDLFIGSGYFRDLDKFSCCCSGKSSIYSREWDFEYREYFKHFIDGIKIGWGLVVQHVDKSDEISEKDKIKQLIGNIKLVEMGPSIHRVSIFIDKHLIGYVDLNPFGRICDAYLIPPHWMSSPNYYVTCSRPYIPETNLRYQSGETDEIVCVPFISVNPDVGVCAQYAVRMALSILSPKPPTVPEVVSEAVKTTLQGGVDRKSQSGWNAEEIHHFLEFNHYGVFRYNKTEPLQCEKCGNIMSDLKMAPSIENIYAYVESGLPVILGIKTTKYLNWWPEDNPEDVAHAIVAIGHTLGESGSVKGLIVHDESKYPYQILEEPLREGKKIEDIIIDAIAPVPREVTVEYQVAKKLATEFGDLGKDNIIRPILTDANQTKKWLAEGTPRSHLIRCELPSEIRNNLLEAYFDRYVWIFELRKEIGEGNRQYIGDIIVSATSPRILAAILPESDIYAYRDKNGKPIQRKFHDSP